MGLPRLNSRLLLAVYAACLAAFFLLHLAAEPVVPEIRVSASEIRFNATRAYEYAYKLATSFPYRPTGSDGALQAFLWIRSELSSMGYQVFVQEFEVTIEKRRIGRNVYAVLAGDKPEAIAVLANYDMVPMSFQAASDTAGHVGVLLELARSMKESSTNRGVVFAFVDSEEWGMQGAKHFVERYEGPLLKAVVVVEDLTVGNLVSIYLESMGQFTGYSPLWLRKLCRDVGKHLNVDVVDPSGFEEYVYRAVDISFTDQGPVIAKMIPAVEVSSKGDSPTLARQVYHTTDDRMENMRINSFDIYGRYIATLVKSLGEADSIPPYSADYLTVGDSFLHAWITYAAPALLTTPILIHAVVLLERRRELTYGFLELGAYFAAFAVSFLLVALSPSAGLIPRYDTYPPPPRHPYLYTPNPLTYILFITPPAVAALLTRLEKQPTPFPPIAILSAAAITSLFYNRFGTVVLLSPILVLWPWIPYVRRRILRASLLLAGLSTFILLLAQFGETIYLGPLITWYLLLGVAYGQFQPLGNIISSLTTSVMVYMLKHYIVKR
ncbi:MAG: M28 family peptidase [Candidatus Caldarchaeum sp.]